jgi:hypothetical protein
MSWAPGREGTPQQGYQSRFTPQEVYRIAIREIDQHCKAALGRSFAQLPGDRQLRLLQQLEKDEIALPSLSSKFFFDLLWRNTDEGYFEYRHLVTSSEPYHAEPVSVLDVQTGRVPVDAEGFPKHVIIKRDRSN